MTKHELPKTYDFTSTEPRVYEMWERGGYFRPSNDPNRPGFDASVKPFVISIPPPNVTGELHLGHAMFVSMEDLMIRYHRMKGVPALWVPGTDHAGIATQLMVERDLLKSEEVTREELGREEFVNRTWEWKKKYGGIITNQIRRLGASCDWSRERFTLDDGLSRAVREAFVRLYEKGMIYRGPRLINWSPGLKTAVSDLEVEYSEEEATLYYFKYMLKGSDEFIPVATVRPETILGDTAVAVHPEDERYKHLVGRMAIVPVLGREIPVIADDYVSREFGTGALKITPGHDPNDYDIAMRHHLPIISMLDASAKVNENGGPYQGQDRFECREKLWADMKKAGLVIKTQPYTTTIPRSQRGGEIVEPMISTQWFVKITPLAKAALAAVTDGRIRIVPDRFEKVYFNWMENIKDWCISRQLWWGHRIPVWYCPDGHMTTGREDPTKCGTCGSSQLSQDPDVLDTWFSSGLWPFSTLGWPEQTPDLKYFYPTSIMETGYDILFFWVARMIMMGLEFTGEAPFHTVYLHGLIRDDHGHKMSKTSGNVIDPLNVMDELGTDALRFTLLVGSAPGNDTNLSVKKVEANRNFANKIWNVGRFVIAAIDKASAPSPAALAWTTADRGVWALLQSLIRSVEGNPGTHDPGLFAKHEYGEAGRQIYDFFWAEFADWYLEMAKLNIAKGGSQAIAAIDTLPRVLDLSLRLLHPFTPFVTEELWGHLREALLDSPLSAIAIDWPDALIIAPFPLARKEEVWEAAAVSNYRKQQGIIRETRNRKAEEGLRPSEKTTVTYVDAGNLDLLRMDSDVIAGLSGTYPPVIVPYLDEVPVNTSGTVSGSTSIFIGTGGAIDLNAQQDRLLKELTNTQAQIARLEQLLAGDFSQKAPPPVVEKERERLRALQETAKRLREQLTY
jgi:valyl-tRNA synthetase